MRSFCVFVGLSVAWMSLGSLHGEECRCEDEHREPFLKFLNDFHCLRHGLSYRDPYEERLETERHDFTQSTKTVGRGVAQVEAGYSYFYKDHEDEIEHSHTTPETLLRIGLSDDIELRFRWTYGWRFIDVADDFDSAQDMILAVKLGMTEQCGLIPDSALTIRSSVPTGGAAWSRERVEVGFDLIYGWELAEGLELYGSTGNWPGGLGDFSLLPEEPAGDDFQIWSQSVALGIELTDRSVLYGEWFGLFSHALEDNVTISLINFGVDYYVTDDFVLDVRAGFGVTPDSDDFFAGVGGGYRF